MALMAAREIHDDDIVFCGTGISMVAAMAAKHISAPHSIIFFETGGIDCQLHELPLSVGDPRVMVGTTINAGLVESFAILQNPRTGPRTVAILGAAQIDPLGNLNSTCLGDYHRPRMRFPGAGGASDAAAYAGRVITFMKQERRRFVQRLDYFSAPGWPDDPQDRFRAGLRLPQSRTMPSIGNRRHELRINDRNLTWRIIYRIYDDAILILEVFEKKTIKTPKSIIDVCKQRIKRYDADAKERDD